MNKHIVFGIEAKKKTKQLSSKNAQILAMSSMAALLTACGATATPTPTPITTDPDSFTLTNDTDIATANEFNAGLVYTPGGNDRINALQDEDELTGSGTNPTLNVTLGNSNDNGANIVTPKLTGIEVINVAFTGSGGLAVFQLDLQDATGITDAINITRISDGSFPVLIDNIDTLPIDLSVSNSGQVGQAILFAFDETPIQGSTDSINLILDDVQLGSLSVQERAGTIDNGIETINLKSIGAENILRLFAEDLQTLNITGDKALTLGAMGFAALAATPTQAEATTYASGLGNVAGSLMVVDASGLTEAFTYVIGTEINAVQDGTSGDPIQLMITGTAKDDKFVLASGSNVDAAANNTDIIMGGDGIDTLVHLGGEALKILAPTAGPNILSIEALEIRTGHDVGVGGGFGDFVTMDADAFDSLATIYVRNEGQTNGVVGAENMEVQLKDLTVAQAKAVTIAHGTTGNNGVFTNRLNVALKDVTGSSDLAEITIVNGVNVDPRFNFIFDAVAIESVTFHDNDTESNSVQLINVATHFGTITVDGGSDGTFFNLDVRTNITGKDTSGLTSGDLTFITDAGNSATAERIVASTFDASGSKSDIIARFSDAATSAGFTATGGQDIKTGEGDDFIVFDQISAAGNQGTAGLTISDKVDLGAGNDVLALDGNGSIINILASEWTNVSNVETIQLIGNGFLAGTNNLANSLNNYNLTLTNSLISKNGVASGSGRVINIVNDNDPNNDVLGTADVGGGTERGVTIDAHLLDAAHNFTYNGEEGATRTFDRFIMSDANVNGMAIIDGGAQLNLGNVASNLASGDILEVRNASVITVGDLANIQNVSVIEFTNDSAAIQNSILQLNDNIVDAMVNGTRGAATGFVETLTITAIDNVLVPAATTGLNLDGSAITNAFLSLNVTGGGGTDTLVGGAGDDVFTGGAGADSIIVGIGNDTVIMTDNTHDVAFTGETLLTGATLAGGETITFANGVDTIAGFISGTDSFDVATANAVTAFTAATTNANLTANANYTLRGDFDAVTGAFTIDFVAGADTAVIFDATANALDDASQNWAIFTGITSLAAADFV